VAAQTDRTRSLRTSKETAIDAIALKRPVIGTGLILMIPLVMTYIDRKLAAGDGWRWRPLDFVVMGALLLGAGLGYELLARKLPQQRNVLLGAAILAVVLLVWAELAVDGVSQLVDGVFG
jgi:hypothetical protein